MGVFRGWICTPIDLAVSNAGTTVGIVLSCAIALALETRSVPVRSMCG